MDAIREVGPGNHFLGCAHTQANFESAFYRSPIADNNSFEQWQAEGSLDMAQRANAQLEAAARRVRRAAAGSGDRRCAARLHRPPQSLQRPTPTSECFTSPALAGEVRPRGAG